MNRLVNQFDCELRPARYPIILQTSAQGYFSDHHNQSINQSVVGLGKLILLNEEEAVELLGGAASEREKLERGGEEWELLVEREV